MYESIIAQIMGEFKGVIDPSYLPKHLSLWTDNHGHFSGYNGQLLQTEDREEVRALCVCAPMLSI